MCCSTPVSFSKFLRGTVWFSVNILLPSCPVRIRALLQWALFRGFDQKVHSEGHQSKALRSKAFWQIFHSACQQIVLDQVFDGLECLTQGDREISFVQLRWTTIPNLETELQPCLLAGSTVHLNLPHTKSCHLIQQTLVKFSSVPFPQPSPSHYHCQSETTYTMNLVVPYSRLAFEITILSDIHNLEGSPRFLQLRFTIDQIFMYPVHSLEGT